MAAVLVLGMATLGACKSKKIEAPIVDNFGALPSSTPAKLIPDQPASLPVGQTVEFKGTAHGSVGLAFDIDYDKEFFDCEYKSEWANPSKKDMPGGDKRNVTYTLKAKKSGTTTITTREIFRGTVMHENVFPVIIK